MSRIILTAEEMRAAEAAAIDAGTPVETLMERAGLAAAEASWRFAGPLPTLILCGPGNNGGDGYVIARALRERGVEVRLAALGEPKTKAAQAALKAWGLPVESVASAAAAPLVIDALFGTGLTRPLDPAIVGRLRDLASAAKIKVAVDLPSGVATDDGTILSPVPDYDMTVCFQTLKPSHLLQPAARHMGRVVIADIGLSAKSSLAAIARPKFRPPGPDDHKYKRGHVLVVGGDMPGAAALSASAAASAGAGYVSLAAGQFVTGVARAVVQGGRSVIEWLSDERVGAVVIGPGLGRSPEANPLLAQALACGRPLVLDADALVLIGESAQGLGRLASSAILTPHHGEFETMFPHLQGSKVDRARAAAAQSGAIIVYKGADTVVASPDGRAAIAGHTSHWLATAGTGDVLAGIIAALRASGSEPFEAACAGVWLHGRAAERAGSVIIADDLISHLADSVRDCL